MKRFTVNFAVILLFSIPAPAQTNPTEVQSNSTILKTTSQAVVVDVVVTKDGAPVTDLHKEAFQVWEDGKPQSIDFFEEHTSSNAPGVELPELPADVFSNEPPMATRDAVNVLLIDRLNTPEADQARVHKQIVESPLQLRSIYPMLMSL